MNKKTILLLFFSVFTYWVGANGFLITNGLTHEHRVDEGVVYRGSIDIENPTSKESNVKLYIQDYRFFATGEIFYDDPLLKNNKRSNADWIQFSTNFLTLQPESKQKLEYEIFVPDSLADQGTYWSMVMLEGIDDSDFEEKKEGQVQIRTLIRYGVQIVTHVGEGGEKDLSFDQFSLSYDEENNPHLVFDIMNTGTLLLRPEFKVELFNEQGESVSVVEQKGDGLYPQTSTRNDIPFANIPAGIYKALVLVDTHDDDIFATEINLDIKSE